MAPPETTSPADAALALRREKTAADVCGAFRAAARARRGRHQKPAEVLTRAFAASAKDGDGRVSPEEFRDAASKLGLEVPLADALAVFETTEHVMRAEAEEEDPRRHPGGKENEDAASGKDRSGAAAGTRRHPREADDDATPATPADPAAALLPYLPWIESVLGLPRPRPRPGGPDAVRGSAHAPPAPSSRAPAPPTRRGPLREEDLPATPADAFVYPQCRSSVFPPPGWTQAHVQRGAALPGITLELDHVHGCGPGLVDQACAVPIFCLPAKVPAKPPKRGKEMDERALALERKATEEAVFYAAGVCVVQTLRVDDEEARVEDDDEDEEDGGGGAATKPRRKKGRGGKPLPPPPPPPKPETRSQRHFRGHADDVRCLTVHETTRLAASGDMGVEPCVMVWCVDERGGHPPLARLRHPRGSRAVIGACFDAAGDRVATVCGDDGHTVSLWRWDEGARVSPSLGVRSPKTGRMLWSARSYQTTPPAVKGLAFTPDPLAPDLLVSFGTTHVRFWTPETDVPVPDGEVGSAEAHQAALRRPWRTRAGKNVRPEDVRCGVFLPWRVADEDSAALVARSGPLVDDGEPTIPPAEEGLSRGVNFVTGSPRGALLFWEKGDGSVPARAVAGSRHRAAVNALALSPSRRHQGSPRLLLSGDAAGAVMCWAVCSSTGTVVAPLGGVWLVETPPKRVEAPPPAYPPSVASSEIWLESDLENDALDTGDGEPLPEWLESYPDVRGLAWSPSGKYYLVTTAQGSAWRVILEPEPEEEEDEDEDEDDGASRAGSDVVTETGVVDDEETPDPAPPPPRPPRMRVMIRGHDSALTCVAWSDSGRGARLGLGRGWFATGASSGRVVIWNAKTRDAVTSFDAGGAVHCLAFSPDGYHLAAGLDRGLLAVFSVVNDPQLAPPNDVLVRFHAAVAGGLRARVSCAAYSPDGSLLAAGDALGNLELYRSRASGRNDRTYRRRGRCAGHCSTIAHVDWSADGRVVRSSSSSYEILHHAAPTGMLLTRRADVAFPADARTTASVLSRGAPLGTEAGERAGRDGGGGQRGEKVTFGGDGSERGGWHTWTTPLGFELMGIWPKGADGTDINEVWRTQDGKHVFSADDDGCLRVLNFPCANARAPALKHRAHSSHVSAARGSWCDRWVASAGGRDCAVMQWRVAPSQPPATNLAGFFELTVKEDGERARKSVGVAGFDRGDLDELGVVEVRTVDAATANAARAGNVVVVERSDDDGTSSDDGDDGIWDQDRLMDVARVDDVYDDMMRDIDVVVPEQAVNKNVRIARYALRLQKPGEPKTKLWTTREEVAERRRKLENELRGLGREREARRVAGKKARERAEWQPAASANAGERPPDRPPPEAPEEAEEDEDGDGDEDGQGRAEDEGKAAGADDA
jgi:WD40 repeat protein